ncbi:MAG: hypothetical protein IT384_28640 [Deltaproteobacteria bacterium]|nr:hypothetical protein [Deltaproteobacteria bacterium]
MRDGGRSWFESWDGDWDGTRERSAKRISAIKSWTISIHPSSVGGAGAAMLGMLTWLAKKYSIKACIIAGTLVSAPATAELAREARLDSPQGAAEEIARQLPNKGKNGGRRQ